MMHPPMILMSLIQLGVLLTLSFFVLYTLRKPEASGLKVLGYTCVVLLWFGASLIFAMGVCKISSKAGMCPMMSKASHQGQMQNMSGCMNPGVKP